MPSLTRVPSYALLLLLLLAGIVVSLGVGAVALTPGEVVRALLGDAVQSSDATIIWQFRLPRALLVCVCGAALGAAGAGLQGLFRNPLADPSVVGASSGAALGATVALVLGGSGQSVLPLGVAGFIGALGAVCLVYALAEASGVGSLAALLLVGAALSTMLSAMSSLLLLLNDQALPQVFAWLLGGFGGRSWGHLQQALLLAPPGMLALWLMARPLDALMTGEEGAQALGLNLRWARFVIIGGASLLTAASVAAAGIIGFVGLIAPHIARPLFGNGHAHVIPASMLLGALLLLVADGFARTLLAPLEVPVGIFTAMLGGPFFLILLRARALAMSATTLSAHELTLAHRKRPVVRELSLQVRAGELLGLIGPNGAGKTSVLRALAGTFQPELGAVLMDARALRDFSPLERARHIGVVPQSEAHSGALSVEEMVALGRAAHRGWLLPLAAADRAAIERALDQTGLTPLRARSFDHLSGGERRLVLLARALAQAPRILLLDEPTADLDIHHQLQVLDLLRALAAPATLAVAIAIHDLSLAARYCDRLALLHQGRLLACGAPETVLTREQLRAVYDVDATLYRDPHGQWALSYQRGG